MSCNTQITADIINDCTKRPVKGIYPTAWIMAFEGRQYAQEIDGNGNATNNLTQLTAPALNFYKIGADKFALNAGSSAVISEVKRNGFVHKFTAVLSQAGNAMLDKADGAIVIVKKGTQYIAYGVQNGLWKSAQSRMANDNSGMVTVEFSSRADMEEDFSEYLFENFATDGEVNEINKSLTADTIALILSILANSDINDGLLIVNGGTSAAIGTWSAQAVADKATLVSRGWAVTNNV